MAESGGTFADHEQRWHDAFISLASLWFDSREPPLSADKRPRARALESALDEVPSEIQHPLGFKSIEDLIDGKRLRAAKRRSAVAFDHVFHSGTTLTDLWDQADVAKLKELESGHASPPVGQKDRPVRPEPLPSVDHGGHDERPDSSDLGTELTRRDEPAGEPGKPAQRPGMPLGRRTRLTVGAALFLLAVLAAAVLALSTSRGSEIGQPEPVDEPGSTGIPSADMQRCVGAVADLDESVLGSPQAPALKAALRDTLDEQSLPSQTCPIASAHRLGPLVVQEFGVYSDESQAVTPDGALVVVERDPTRRWWFNRALWGTFHQQWEQLGPSADTYIGAPTAVESQPDGTVEVPTDKGGVFVAESADAPYFWITFLHTAWWRANRSVVGLPISRPNFFGRAQQFTNGSGTLPDESILEPTFIPFADPATFLPTGPLAGKVLRQEDGTSWLITESGGRQWIPDPTTYGCVHGDEFRLPDKNSDVAPQAIVTLPYEGIAKCP